METNEHKTSKKKKKTVLQAVGELGHAATKQKVYTWYFPWISLTVPLHGLPNNSTGILSVTLVIYGCSLAKCLLYKREENWHFKSIKTDYKGSGGS